MLPSDSRLVAHVVMVRSTPLANLRRWSRLTNRYSVNVNTAAERSQRSGRVLGLAIQGAISISRNAALSHWRLCSGWADRWVHWRHHSSWADH